jgi:hypothetical protein
MVKAVNLRPSGPETAFPAGGAQEGLGREGWFITICLIMILFDVVACKRANAAKTQNPDVAPIQQ